MYYYKGFKVVVISRDKGKLEKLRGFVSPSTKGNLTTLVGNVGKSLTLRAVLRTHMGRLVSIGGFVQNKTCARFQVQRTKVKR